MTLLAMLEFFEHNGISPDENLGPHIQTIENLIKKRINGVIAILRDIEKSQTKPTVAMMESLFKEAAPKQKPLMVEKKKMAQKEQVRIRESKAKRFTNEERAKP